VPGEAQLVPLGAAADGGQQLVHLGLGQPDPVVLDAQRVGARGDLDDARAGAIDGRDRVDGVLQQLPDVDAWARVQVVAEQVDDAP
jgi:hypothetical protein